MGSSVFWPGEFEDLLDFESFETAQQAVVIHGQQGEEAGAVGLGVLGGGQQQAEDGGAAEDESCAPTICPRWPESGCWLPLRSL